MASSSVVFLAKIFSGDFVAIRYSVSAVLLAAIFMFSEVLKSYKWKIKTSAFFTLHFCRCFQQRDIF